MSPVSTNARKAAKRSRSRSPRRNTLSAADSAPRRVVISAVRPEIDGGRFPIKRVVGEPVVVEADIFADGHESLSGVLRYRLEWEPAWTETALEPLGNDRWQARFTVKECGRYRYALSAWVDRFKTWRLAFAKRVEAGQDVRVELLIGAELVRRASRFASGAASKKLQGWAAALEADGDTADRIALALAEELSEWMDRYPDREGATFYDEKELAVVVDRKMARFSAWYELFPRSCSPKPGAHGTFKDCEGQLASLAAMGFDVLYLPPIHPIGFTHRKGRNNALGAAPGDPGSPWAIGAKEGGHVAVHPELGTLQDFKRLVAKAREQHLEIALDLAFQCSPDHPYVRQHPEWFSHRPDGTIRYAENPPKKYEDIYPFDFETAHRRALWEELKGVVAFWVAQGIRIFRVDNPHTKPFAFWEWLIGEIKRDYPDVIFLAEAFTRPKIMYRLAKLGFTQSYTYFAWRNTKRELEQYFTELTQTEVREFFRPHLWPNTPDILTQYLQTGGRSAFMIRFILAATLGAGYGIYGPAFELCEAAPRQSGSEEYLHCEKYELRHWELGHSDHLRELIARVNLIRRDNPALQSDWSLRFHPIDNEQLIGYSKSAEEGSNPILVIVNLDPHHTHSGWIDFACESLGLDPHQPYQVHDLLSGARYTWRGCRNYVELNPQLMPAHLFRIRRRVRTERDFEYYL